MFHGLMDMFDLPDTMLSDAAQGLSDAAQGLGDAFDAAMDRACETMPEGLEFQPRQEDPLFEDLMPIAAATGAAALGYGYLASEEAEEKRQAEAQRELDFLNQQF